MTPAKPMNLDEIAFLTPEQHARAELQRYYQGEVLEKVIVETLHWFDVVDRDITEFDFVETREASPYTPWKHEVRLIWQKRLSSH